MDALESQQLLTALYDRLRAIARARMSGQGGAAHTLDPTGLANETVLRLLKWDASQIRDEQHFLALAAEAMRQILVDHARARSADKRGGGVRAQPLSDDMNLAVRLRAEPEDVIALSEALIGFEEDDAEAAAIVKMRAFAGMEPEQIAALLGVSRRTVERRWRYAMAALRSRIAGDDEAGAEDPGVGVDERPPSEDRRSDLS